MDAIDKIIIEWMENLTTFSLPSWEQLPDLDLYMDQVITYLERELSSLSINESEKAITTWMINNYVKDNLLPSSFKKKYGKEHLAYLLAITSIKQILAIPRIATLFAGSINLDIKSTELYSYFLKTHREAINQVAQDNLDIIKATTNKQNKSFLYDIVFKLAIEAQAKKIMADKILYLLEKNDEFYKDEIERLTKEQAELQKIEREIKTKKKTVD